MKFKARWGARVEQDEDIEADSEEEAREYLSERMNPRNVVELLDFETLEFEQVGDVDGA